MTLLFEWFTQPLGIIFFFLIVSLALAMRRGSGTFWSRFPLVTGVLLLWAASAPITANWLVQQVELTGSETSCETADSATPVVILGGGMNPYVLSDSPLEVLSQDTVQRTLKSISLDSGANTFYVLGGGKTSRKLGQYMKLLLVEQGINPERVMTEVHSQSTLENARELSRLLPADQTPEFYLVTSALHMKRAQSTFKEQGYPSICPISAVSLYAPSAGWVGALPYIGPLTKTTLAAREWLAITWYRWRLGI